MLKRNHFLLSAVFAIGMAMPTMAKELTASTVVATVNGTEITFGHMVATRATLPEQYQSLPNEVLFQGILDQLVQQVTLSQSLNGEPNLRTRLAIENESRALRAGEVIDTLVAKSITEEAIQAAYDKRFAEAEPSKEFNASHILVETEEEANEVKKQLDGGADFADVAKEKSTGPSGPSGGSLGWFGAGMMVKPFEDAVLTLDAGGVSAPVQTQFGWHVIILNETRLTEAPSLESIRDELKAEVEQATIASSIETLTASAEITRLDASDLNVESLSDMSLLEE